MLWFRSRARHRKRRHRHDYKVVSSTWTGWTIFECDGCGRREIG